MRRLIGESRTHPFRLNGFKHLKYFNVNRCIPFTR